MDIVAELETMVVDTKRLRALAIAELRSMSKEDLAKLEPHQIPTVSYGVNRFVKKVYRYPSDLSLTRLADVLKRKKELNL